MLLINLAFEIEAERDRIRGIEKLDRGNSAPGTNNVCIHKLLYFCRVTPSKFDFHGEHF
jgi:hypothetical protein